MRPLNIALRWNLVLCLFMLVITGNALGDTDTKDDPLPLWEVGVAAVGARLPHYIGSDEYNNYFYPVPYFIYRGDILRSDRDGVRGIFYKGEKFETSLSFWGNPPVSDDNGAREGMPELDAIAEAGPALKYFFYRHKQLDHLYLQTAVLAAWSVGFPGGLDIDMAHEGWHGRLGLYYQNKSLLEAHKLSFYLNTGVHYADSEYNDYFYSVDDRYVTADRAAYDAEGGYAGFSVSGSLYQWLTDRIGYGLYARWNNIDGAVFEDSSLVREENNYAIGCTLTWKMAVSKSPAPQH